QPIMRHLVELFAAVKCFERNHTTAGRQRFGCTEGSFLITPREKPDSAAFSIAMQWTGNVEVPLQALESAPPFTWLKGCGFTFPPPRSQAAADSLYIYQHDALCWNAASCPPHCRAASKFLSAAKLAAQAAGCTALEGDARVTFTCQGPTAREDCRRNLDGEIARFNLKKRDRDVAGQLAFTITYRGNAVETCNGSAYRPGSGEGALFGPGFPDFLIKLRDDCHPR
ncbi:MAG: hypothetical protein K0R38_7659, partial [Polyangiaceae bacterium]|nr:hypothetical protein [Polyangiaceae bacterium]